MTWLAIKAFLGAAWGFLRAVPWQAWLLLAAVAAAWWYGQARYDAGQADVQARWDAAVAADRAAAASAAGKQGEVTERVVTKYVDRIQVVREKGATIVKEVPRYVSASDCPLPPGFRVLHDAAAENRVPDPAAVPDAAAVAAQDAAGTVADNYLTCHETRERLIALQEWVREQSEVK